MRYLLCLFLFSNAWASDCADIARSKLIEESELMLVQKHPLMFSQYLDCQSETFGLEVIVHEATHMEDVGAPTFANQEELARWFEDLSHINFSLFLMNGKKMGELATSDFPTPYEMIHQFMDENYPTIMSDDGHSIHSLITDYIDDHVMLSSNSFSKGLTEFNAYAHGLRTEFRLAGKVEGRKGLLGFSFFLKAYLYQLRRNDPEKFARLLTAGNRQYLSALVTQAAEVLTYTGHCQNLEQIEKRDFFDLFNDQKYFEGLTEILTDGQSLNTIRCQQTLP